MKKVKSGIMTALLLAAPLFANSQYFQSLFDIDSSQDFGIDIFIQADGSFIVKGTSLPRYPTPWILFNVQISLNGNSIVSNKTVNIDSIDLYVGYPNETKVLPSGGYISPITEQLIYHPRSWGGLVKYNSTGDTVFIKTYTDTSLYYDRMFSCAVMPDGGYMAGGQHSLNTSAHAPGYLIRTDSLGDTLWTRTYWRDTNTLVQINSIIPLADGRIVVGAASATIKHTSLDYYYYSAPWYMLLDSLGNIIRDTIYTSGYQCCGFIYKDMSGGYGTMGNFDSVYNPDPGNIENFPSFVAHLDTNFRITWSTSFPYSPEDGHREKWLLKQLHDSEYIVLGDKWTNTLPGNYGWAAKLDRNGSIVWNRYYQSDTANSSYIRDMAEKPDGSLVFVGTSYNDTLPTWHNQEDLWLIGVDSNGCENAWCSPTAVKPTPVISRQELLIYPNPTAGNFTVQTTLNGIFAVYTLPGQLVMEYPAHTGQTDIQMRVDLAPGIYLGVFRPGDGGAAKTIRLIYQP